jgi:hypothetical protein
MSAPGHEDTDMNDNETTQQIDGLAPALAPGVLRAAMLLAAVLLLAACAATAPKGQGQVVERAQARWDAIIARDYDTAYALCSPGYRSATSRVDYEIELRSRRISWTAATYREHRCDGKVCTVTFDVEYVAPRPVPGLDKWEGKSSVEDTWIETSGEWWFVPPEG